ncbi:MAG: flagellar export chaperone FliS, partial [Bacillota bacterium]
ATNLSALYDYMYRQLIQANIKKDPRQMEEVHAMLRDLRNTWVEAIRSNNGQHQTASVQRTGLTV